MVTRTASVQIMLANALHLVEGILNIGRLKYFKGLLTILDTESQTSYLIMIKFQTLSLLREVLLILNLGS